MPWQRAIQPTEVSALRLLLMGATALACCALIICLPVPYTLWPLVLSVACFALGYGLGPSLRKAEVFWGPVAFALVVSTTVFACTEKALPPGPLYVVMLVFGAGAAAAVASGRAFRRDRRWRYPLCALGASAAASGLAILALSVLVGPP